MLDQMQQSLRASKAEVRWVAIPSIHLTLKFLGEVDYVLQVSVDLPSAEKPSGHLVTGTLRRIDKERILWGSELLTLHLQDRRKLDFVCVNYDPDCEIASTAKFYF